MARQFQLAPGAFTTLVTRGIPAVTLALGVGACKDDVVPYYPPADDADSGGGGETGGDVLDQDSSGGDDTGHESGGDVADDTEGGSDGGQDTDPDLDTVEDTDGSGDPDGEDTEPDSAETIIARFCEVYADCRTPDRPVAGALDCQYSIEEHLIQDRAKGQHCYDAYLEAFSHPEMLDCEPDGEGGHMPRFSATSSEFHAAKVACSGLSHEQLTQIEAACVFKEGCIEEPVGQLRCETDLIWDVENSMITPFALRCLATDATCLPGGTIDVTTCES